MLEGRIETNTLQWKIRQKEISCPSPSLMKVKGNMRIEDPVLVRGHHLDGIIHFGGLDVLVTCIRACQLPHALVRQLARVEGGGGRD